MTFHTVSGRHADTGNESEWRFPLDETRRSQGLALIRQAASKKRIRHYPALPELIWSQLCFQPLEHWLAQGCTLLIAIMLSLWLRREYSDAREITAVCSVFFVFAGNIFLSHIARLFSWHMAELEQTLYLNLKQMICIKMLETGIADLIILVLFLGLTGSGDALGLGAALTYMLVPFLWSDTLYLHMLFCLRSASCGFRSLALGILCGIFALFPILWESAYQPEYLPVWQVLGIAGGLLLAAQISVLLGKIDQGDSICLD